MGSELNGICSGVIRLAVVGGGDGAEDVAIPSTLPSMDMRIARSPARRPVWRPPIILLPTAGCTLSGILANWASVITRQTDTRAENIAIEGFIVFNQIQSSTRKVFGFCVVASSPWRISIWHSGTRRQQISKLLFLVVSKERWNGSCDFLTSRKYYLLTRFTTVGHK